MRCGPGWRGGYSGKRLSEEGREPLSVEAGQAREGAALRRSILALQISGLNLSLGNGWKSRVGTGGTTANIAIKLVDVIRHYKTSMSLPFEVLMLTSPHLYLTTNAQGPVECVEVPVTVGMDDDLYRRVSKERNRSLESWFY